MPSLANLPPSKCSGNSRFGDNKSKGLFVSHLIYNIGQSYLLPPNAAQTLKNKINVSTPFLGFDN